MTSPGPSWLKKNAVSGALLAPWATRQEFAQLAQKRHSTSRDQQV
jgi:hypothetical protein